MPRYKTSANNLSALRAQLALMALDGLVVPLTDEHMSEYVGAYAERLPWVTGFTGSAGNAVILKEQAAIFVDGRYTIQVAQEVNPDLIEAQQVEAYPLLKWTADHVSKGARIGYDPELVTTKWEEEAHRSLEKVGAELVRVQENPIDTAWSDQPAPSLIKAKVHTLDSAGETASEKRERIANSLKEKGADTAVITMLDSVAWAFNIRGEDVAHMPVVHAYALLNNDASATLFINPEKVTHEVREHLGNGVEIRPRDDFYGALTELGKEGKAVLVDPKTNNAKVFNALIDSKNGTQENGARLIKGDDPCIILKAVKNNIEQQGSIEAHIRDGAAVCNFLAWFDREAPKGGLTEINAAEKLWSCRQATGRLLDSSFDTISGSGPNGAIVHYRVTNETNRAIKPGDMYLVDSGAQYSDGTTDITRTTYVGDAPTEHKDRFTRVLKGHINLATTVFPQGTSGAQLDSIARRPLWEAGLDYDHGTGHGVGSYLAVHEGPQRIAKFGTNVPLQAGMILSNEPGYYKTGEYGIRIENLVLVKEVSHETEREMLCFQTLTLAPIDKRLIDTSLLSDDELQWLNRYHARVRQTLENIVHTDTKSWLSAMTKEISRTTVAKK